MQPTVTHSTFSIERSYPAAPERVFAAFSDPQKKRRWFVEAHDVQPGSHQMDFRVGGVERTQSKLGPNTPFPGVALENDTTYLDIEPNRRIAFAYCMSVGGRRISASLATVELVASETGTHLIFTDQGAYFEGADGPAMRERGWNGLLDGIAREVRA